MENTPFLFFTQDFYTEDFTLPQSTNLPVEGIIATPT